MRNVIGSIGNAAQRQVLFPAEKRKSCIEEIISKLEDLTGLQGNVELAAESLRLQVEMGYHEWAERVSECTPLERFFGYSIFQEIRWRTGEKIYKSYVIECVHALKEIMDGNIENFLNTRIGEKYAGFYECAQKLVRLPLNKKARLIVEGHSTIFEKNFTKGNISGGQDVAEFPDGIPNTKETKAKYGILATDVVQISVKGTTTIGLFRRPGIVVEVVTAPTAVLWLPTIIRNLGEHSLSGETYDVNYTDYTPSCWYGPYSIGNIGNRVYMKKSADTPVDISGLDNRQRIGKLLSETECNGNSCFTVTLPV